MRSAPASGTRLSRSDVGRLLRIATRRSRFARRSSACSDPGMIKASTGSETISARVPSKSVTSMTRAGAKSEIAEDAQTSCMPAVNAGRTTLRLRRHAGSYPRSAHQVADVLDLAADPARDVIGAHDVARALVAPPLFLHAHHQAAVDRVGGRLDVERVDRQDVRMQLLM